MNRVAVAAAVAALLAGFGGGVVAAKFIPSSPAPGAPASSGFDWPFFGKPRAANAARPAVSKPDGFAVWRTRVDTAAAAPLACIQMSRPLDPSKPYGDFVLVSPAADHAPSISVKADELCLGGLGFADRRITLLKGFPAQGGETLAANADVDFTFGDKPPYVGFAGDGVILPRTESDGVGIETINVSRLAIEVWRAPDRNLVRRSIATSDPTPEGDYPDNYSDTAPDPEARVVWKGEVAVKGDPGSRVTTVFPLGAALKEMKPGGYVIKARDISGGRALKSGDQDDDPDAGKPAQARRWVIFTDMALTAYDGSDGLDVVVRSLQTAKTLGGIKVALMAADGEALSSASADGSGRLHFAKSLMAGKGSTQAKMLMAYGDKGDLAILDLERPPVDLSAKGSAGHEDTGGEAATAGRTLTTPVDGFVYSDRGIYRPGETIHLTALLRDREAKAVKDRKASLVIKRPSGVEFQKIAFNPSANGAISQDVALPKTAPRGRWQAELRIEGVDQPAGQMAFSVEDFVPQRLAVTADGAAARAVGAGETRKVDIQARFLYGAIGAGLQTQAEARLRTDPNPFPQYKDYRWGDELKPFEEKFVDLGNSTTDGEGKAVALVDTSAGADAKSPLEAAVAVSVFEPGGRPVRESLMLKVRPLPLYLGVHVDPVDVGFGQSAPVNMDVVAVDSQGARVAAAGVNWKLVSENWDYDWFQQDGKWQWRRTSRDVIVGAGQLDVGQGGSPARLAKRLGAGDYRLEMDGPSGARTVLRFSAGWGGPSKDNEAPDTVRVSTGDRSYVQGDTVDVAIKGPYGGEVQVAVATDHLIDFKTATLGAGGGTVHLKTTAAWGGGAYVLVSIIQPRDPGVTPKPRRAIGLVYVPLDPKGRKLTVVLGTVAQLRSAAPIDVPVTVQGLGFGQRAHVTVAAVDEGILRLTKFDTPDPVKWYFGKRALTLDYRDDYGRLLDANLGAPANVDFGGDQIGGEGLTVTPVRTVALWSGVVDTGPDGKAVIHLPAADFNGQVRVMAVAWTDSAVGSGQSSITVREPVVTDLNLPRFLSPGDKAFATLELHNIEGRIGQYFAQVTGANGPIAMFKQMVALALGQRTVIRAPVNAPTVAGIGQVSYRVDGPGFSTGRSYPIQTRTGWSPITRVTSVLQAPGQAFTPTSDLMAGLASGSVNLQVSYSPFQGFDPAAVAASLSRYPYGCSEQLVSTAYPLLYSGEGGAKAAVSPGQLGPAIGQLMDRQSLDGAFGLWRVGDGEADPWLGAYVTDFLIQAKAMGAPVPQAGLDRALAAMRQISKPDGFSSVAYRLEYPKTWFANEDAAKKATERLRSRAAAYALYDLAEGGQGDLPRLRWFHDVQFKAEPSPLARAQIGAALALMGDKARAHDAFQQAAAALGFREPQDDYQSPLRDLSGVIALAYQAGETGIAHNLQGRLAGSMRDVDSLNTQEQARLLQAAAAMLKASGPAHITASGAAPLASAGGTPRWSVGRLADAHFVNAGSGPIWRTVTVSGSPMAPPGADAQGLQVTKRLLSFTGQPVNTAALRQGDRVIVLITGVSHQARTTQLVVNDLLAGGFEIESQLGPDDAQTGPFKFLGKLSSPSIQESRDDRYVAAMSLEGNKPFTLAYVARAVTPGDYFLPGVEAKDMYHATVFARSAPARTSIAPGG